MRPSEVLIQLRARPRVCPSFYKKMARGAQTTPGLFKNGKDVDNEERQKRSVGEKLGENVW